MSGSSQAAPHAAGLAAILMQKYETRGEEIRKIMQKQALDIGDPGLFGHGLLQYVSDEEENNNELVSPEEEEIEEEEEPVHPDEIDDETEEGQEEPEEVKSLLLLEKQMLRDRRTDDLVEFYQTEIIPDDRLGTLEQDI